MNKVESIVKFVAEKMPGWKIRSDTIQTGGGRQAGLNELKQIWWNWAVDNSLTWDVPEGIPSNSIKREIQRNEQKGTE